MPRPDPEAVAEAVFAALAEPTPRSILRGLAARAPRPAPGTRPGPPAADHAAGDHQAPRAALRRGSRAGRAGRAPPDPLPRQRGANGDGPVLPRRAGPGLGQQAGPAAALAGRPRSPARGNGLDRWN